MTPQNPLSSSAPVSPSPATIALELAGLAVAMELPRLPEDWDHRYEGFPARREPRIRLNLGFRPSTSDDRLPELSLRGLRVHLWRSMHEVSFDAVTGQGAGVVSDTRFGIDGLARMVFSWLLLERDALLLHAAGVRAARGAFIFPGLSEAGKSTLAEKTPSDGVLSDELTGIQVEAEGLSAFATPFFGAMRRAGQAASVPLRALAFLEKGPRLDLRPLDPRETLRRLAPVTLGFCADAPVVAKVALLHGRIARHGPAFLLQSAKDTPWSAIEAALNSLSF